MESKVLKENDVLVLVGPKDEMVLHVENGKIKSRIIVKECGKNE
jgi:hypothetical protein